jgi:hypothetical protein
MAVPLAFGLQIASAAAGVRVAPADQELGAQRAISSTTGWNGSQAAMSPAHALGAETR